MAGILGFVGVASPNQLIRRELDAKCAQARSLRVTGAQTRSSGFERKMRATLLQPIQPGTWDGAEIDPSGILERVKFNSVGLVPAVAQQFDTGEVLMVAWMSAESIAETLRSGRAVYYSRSRSSLWRKGDTSGQVQLLCDVLLDCDGDTILLKVDQKGVACHTGRRSCFYNAFRPPFGDLIETQPVLMDPKELYGARQS